MTDKVWIDGKGRPRITQTVKHKSEAEFEVMTPTDKHVSDYATNKENLNKRWGGDSY